MIDIAMVSCNRARITACAIQEIRARTTTPYRLLVLDNGSEDDSVRMLQAHYNEGYIDALVLLKENTGIHWAHNTLLDMVESRPYYVCTDNDLIPCAPVTEWCSDEEAIQRGEAILVQELLARPGLSEVKCETGCGGTLRSMDEFLVCDHCDSRYIYREEPTRDPVPQYVMKEKADWLSRLIDLAERNPDYGAVACRPHILIGEGGGLFKDAPEIKDRGHVGAHLRIMKTDDVKATGWKREKRPARNNEEKTICGKLRKRGLKIGYARDIRAIHLFGEKDEGEDPWGYPESHDHKVRGHRDIWPPVDRFAWHLRKVNWETCKREDGGIEPNG